MSILKILSQKLFISENELFKYIKSAPHRYKKYTIPKRNGNGTRDIAQPSKELKFIQKKALQDLEVFKYLPIHESAMAYRKNISIKNNADAHKNSSYLLKMDFANFFPSIKPIDLIKHIEKQAQEVNLSAEDKQIISSLFFYRKRRTAPLILSIGAPSSPFISNTLMYDFDMRINAYCLDLDITYTRYADDLAFSTNTKNILFDVPDFIQNNINEFQSPRLFINRNKTTFLSKNCNRHITGLVISNDGTTSIGRKKKRVIKSMIYNYSKGQLSPREESYLRGYLSYCRGVDNNFLNTLQEKYGESYLNLIRNKD